jgi:hypothetical protein
MDSGAEKTSQYLTRITRRLELLLYPSRVKATSREHLRMLQPSRLTHLTLARHGSRLVTVKAGNRASRLRYSS